MLASEGVGGFLPVGLWPRRSMGRGDWATDPPMVVMTQGMRLSLKEFEAAYSTLEDFIVFQTLGDSNESLGLAIGKITKFYPCEDTGAHIELEYKGCENEFYRWYIEHEGEPGGLPRGFSHHLCRRALSTCMRKEGRKMVHVQKWSAITKEDAHRFLKSWGYAGFAELSRRAPLKRQAPGGKVTGASPKSRATRGTSPEEAAPEDDEAIEVDEDDEAAPEERKHRRRKTKGSVARALETSNVLDSMLEGGPRAPASSGHRDGGGPLEARLAGLRTRLQEKVAEKKAVQLADKAVAEEGSVT